MASTSKPPSNNEVGEWTRMKKLGEGGFGSVYIGKRSRDGKLFAVKSVYFVPRGTSTDDKKKYNEELENEQYALSSLINEIRTLKKLKSAYVVRYFGCGTSNPPELGDRLVLDCYIEYFPRGCLWDVIKASGGSLEEPFIRAYTRDILLGLVYLHYNKIVHGDLKCSNVLVDSKNCKIADFGSVKDVRTSFFKRLLIGTPGFRAPEVMNYLEQTYASDIFSLGCTMVEMATGRSLSPTPTPHGTPQHNKPRVVPDHLSDDCRSFISKCLQIDPRVRWTAADLLQHPFITEPASPRWKPYDISIDPGLEAQILKPDPRDLALILPPNDDYSRGPISPIDTIPAKRRRILASCRNLDETSVGVPKPPPWRLQDQKSETEFRAKEFALPDHMQSMDAIKADRPVPDKHSAIRIKSPPRYQPEPRRDKRKHRLPRTPAALAAISRLKGERWRAQKSDESNGSTLYRGHKVTFGPIAQIEENDESEDKDPLVVRICDEFGIPLPLEYQKWILDPDYDPDAVGTQATTKDNYLKNMLRGVVQVGRKGLTFIFRNDLSEQSSPSS